MGRATIVCERICVCHTVDNGTYFQVTTHRITLLKVMYSKCQLYSCGHLYINLLTGHKIWDKVAVFILWPNASLCLCGWLGLTLSFCVNEYRCAPEIPHLVLCIKMCKHRHLNQILINTAWITKAFLVSKTCVGAKLTMCWVVSCFYIRFYPIPWGGQMWSVFPMLNLNQESANDRFLLTTQSEY